MKKFLFLLLSSIGILLTDLALAQAPQAIPYQAVARKNDGTLFANRSVSLRFSVHDSTSVGTVVYKETQTTSTNSLGLFTVNIGQGTPVTGTFASINWGVNNKFMQVEVDTAGGTNYSNLGTHQLLSVPYALNAGNGNWTKTGNNISNSNSGNVGIGTSSPSTKLEVIGNTKTDNFRMTAGAGVNKKMISDASGNASWVNDSSSGTNTGNVTLAPIGTSGNSSGASLSGQVLTLLPASPITGGVVSAGTQTFGGTKSFLSDAFINGIRAGKGNGSLAFNTAFGTNALNADTSGNDNAAFGFASLASTISGSSNTGLGTAALTSNTSGNYNTAAGSSSLVNNITGNLNTAIGYSSGPATSGLTNSTAIGANTVVSQSNSVVIGNNANVGIGTSTPQAKLDIVGNIKIADGTQGLGKVLTTDSLGFASWQAPASGWLINGNTGTTSSNFLGTTDNRSFRIRTANIERIVFDSLGNVGIGTLSATTKLDVIGTIKATNLRMTSGAGTNKKMISDASGNAIWVTDSSTGTNTGNVTLSTIGSIPNANGASLSGQALTLQPADTTFGGIVTTSTQIFGGIKSFASDAFFNGVRAGKGNGGLTFNTAFGTNSLNANTSGNSNTAIGYLSLSSNSTGGSNAAFGQAALFANSSGNFNTSFGSFSSGNNDNGNLNTALGYASGVSSSSLNNTTAIGANTIVSQSNSVVLGNNANVGIGTSTPNAKLHVVGTIKIVDGSQGQGKVLTADSLGLANWQSVAPEADPQVSSTTANYVPKWNGTSLVDGILYDTGTRIGLGTTSPLTTMHVNSSTTNGGVLITTTNSGTAGTDGFSITLGNAGDALIDLKEARSMHLYTSDVQRLSISATGDVGIGNPTPINTLDVNGAIGLKLTKPATGATLDGTATVWYFTGLGSALFPAASTCTNRLYTIVNRVASARTTSSYINLSGSSVTTMGANSSIEIISDGTNWLQVR